ncbi:transport inhibitor response 1-like protein [Zingiber officinale]|uniref:transport inhibitor response 1-like protein n=1 Tax=Zingiber officinale TaxID=94328 RepID=UPI001C4C819F|nr:transport inhibitor response 1-like protein [Zingiber officinale]XP_042459383.1 transport inhibitor response 1-like protein [Zingiber officinale]XP_042459384.1 transport inhibitor response 1-like protein [Zingiber officinale]XP_042459385.1 transport inhibitor response 1-like protein [Zingiber officinale]XP_042459386.1 transport inhibitor response 1-like protein [Zingiber officinale]
MAEGGEGEEEEERSCASGFGIGGDDGAGCSGSSAPAARMRSGTGGGTEQPPPPPPFSDQVLENVLESVLEFLTCRRDRNAVSLVCRSWYRAEAQTRREVFIGNCYAVLPVRAVARYRSARAMVLKGRPRFDDFSLIPPGWGGRFSPWATAMAAAYPWFERVCLKRITVSDADLALLARSFPSFRDLTLICCDGFGTTGLAAVAELCRNLRVLDLIENDVEDEDEQVVDWISRFPETITCLESLSFECVNCAVNFAALEALVARSPSLRRLRVNEHVSVSQLRRLMERTPQLTHLGTGSFHLVPADAGAADLDVTDLESSFAASKSLVCLSGFRVLDPEYLPAIFPACANLVSLNLSYAVFIAEQLKPVIAQCHNLQTFWVLDTVGDDGLRSVAKNCKKLSELRVFPMDATEDSEGFVSDSGLVAISEGCPNLRSILYFCQRMTNAAVVTMSKNCPNLAVFRLCIMGRHRPDRLTGQPMDEGFGAIVMNCKKLTRLAISGLLTDRVFEYIADHGRSVRTLSVAFSGDSDLSLKHLFQGCPNLKKLEIRDCPFGDAGLLFGVHHFYNMRFLWMSSCMPSLRGCKEVARRLPHLVVEVIADSPQDIYSDAVEKLYLYRSLSGPREDAPPFVNIL